MANYNRSLEIGTGLFVLLGFAALAFLTTQLPASGLRLRSSADSYRVTAEFGDVGDLKSGAPVTMAGVRIGSVESVGIDPQSFRARVTLAFDRQYNKIPEDSWAVIQTAGLLGAKYVGIEPGSDETMLADGSRIENDHTQSAIVLEGLINKLFASIAGKKDSDSK